jgi:hypothetical protein
VGVGRRRGPARTLTAALALVLAVAVTPAVAQEYPPDRDPGAEPITPTPSPPTPPRPTPPRPTPPPPPAPVPDPPTPTPPTPTPPIPAPDPTPTPPILPPGGGGGDAGGIPIDVEVRPAPREVPPDDPVIRIVPGIRVSDDGRRIEGLPPREDGTPREPSLDEVVLVEAGPLALVMSGESCTGGSLAVDGSGALVTTPGGAIVIAAGGFAGRAEAATWLYSDPRLLALQVTGPDGSLGKAAPVPTDTPLGRHVVQVTGVGADLLPYRISLDVLVADCEPSGGLRGLPALGRWLLGLLLGFLGLGWWLLGFRRIHRVRLVAHPGALPVTVRARAVAAVGRRPADAELRGGPSGLDPRDRALEAAGLRLSGGEVLDLDRGPLPVTSVVVVEAGDATWLVAVRRPDGTVEPAADDGLPRLVPGGTLVMVVDGARRGSRLEVTLAPLPEDEDDYRSRDLEVLGRLRADTAGRARGEFVLPDDLGTLALVLGLRLRGR